MQKTSNLNPETSNVYATIMAWPEAGKFTFKAFGMTESSYSGDVEKVELLGSNEEIAFEQNFQGLTITVPSTKPNAIAPVFRITFKAEARSAYQPQHGVFIKNGKKYVK